MERPTFLERMAARIGQNYTVEDHAALVAHVAAIEKAYQQIIARSQDMLATRNRSLIDPEAAEI